MGAGGRGGGGGGGGGVEAMRIIENGEGILSYSSQSTLAPFLPPFPSFFDACSHTG